MQPILFYIGSFPIHTYGALGAVAFLLGAGLSLWRGKRLGMDQNRLADVIFWMAITSLLGARLVFVLQNPGTVSNLAELLDLRGGGLVFYGSFLVGIPVGFALMHRYGLPAFAVWDLFGTAFPLAHAVSRIGCFAAGCCFGAPVDPHFPLAVTFPSSTPETHGSIGGVGLPAIAPTGVPLHPAQLYEALALLLIGLITNLFYRYRRFDGQVFLLYLILYAAARTVLEMFRGDIERGWFLPELLGESLSWSQGMSGVFALLALVVFFWGARARAAKLAVGAQVQGPTGPST